MSDVPMSVRANVYRSSDHQAADLSGYYQSSCYFSCYCQAAVCLATFLSGSCSVGLLSVRDVSLGKCPSDQTARATVWEPYCIWLGPC